MKSFLKLKKTKQIAREVVQNYLKFFLRLLPISLHFSVVIFQFFPPGSEIECKTTAQGRIMAQLVAHQNA